MRCIDLLQVNIISDPNSTASHRRKFHWQDYNDKAYLDALYHLQCLQLEGYIANIGLCNFDTKHVDEICTQLGSGAIVSNQVQVKISNSAGFVH